MSDSKSEKTFGDRRPILLEGDQPETQSPRVAETTPAGGQFSPHLTLQMPASTRSPKWPRARRPAGLGRRPGWNPRAPVRG